MDWFRFLSLPLGVFKTNNTTAAAHTEAETAPTESFLVSAAIDFGTSYSGYAYSLKHDPTHIFTNKGWNADQLISYKTPTCVLLNPQKQFDSFGYEAESKYASLASNDKHRDWLLFRQFKMFLHNKTGLTRRSEVEDINGKRMSAMTIFSMSINYIRTHLMSALRNAYPDIGPRDVMFVVTVPAIWNDASRQFMREAACQGGIDDDHIKLALESEVASIWCQHVDAGKNHAIFGAGSKYMVADLGGGTVDVSVHEKNPDGTFKVLHRPSGGPWGGTTVDNHYIAWLTKMFGKKAMKKLKAEAMEDYFDILRVFENKKRNLMADSNEDITLKLPLSLNKYNKDSEEDGIESVIARLELKGKVKFLGDKIRVPADITRRWFQESIDGTFRHLTEIFSEPAMKDVTSILLVGGFAESKLMQDAVKTAFKDRTVIIPEEAGLAVLKGAVLFGHRPRLVSSRCVTLTYGYGVTRHFDESRHLPEQLWIDSYGDRRVNNCFSKVVEIGTSVDVGTDIKAPSTLVLNIDGESKLHIYASTDRDPEYTTDPSCTKVGELNMGYAPGQTENDNTVQVYFTFGDTELKATVKFLKTGKVVSKTIDCL